MLLMQISCMTLEDLEYSHMDHYYGVSVFMSLFVIFKAWQPSNYVFGTK